jgi:Concanavalin A-like lectin/glucanases superfamily/Beta-galactosidase
MRMKISRRVVFLFCLLLPMLAMYSGTNLRQGLANEGTRVSRKPIKLAVSCLRGRTQLPGGAVGYWPLDTNGFQGVFQFVGQTHPENAAMSNLAGADMEWSWAKVEPKEGDYNWQLVDQNIGVWTARGKQVILRFSTGGQAKWSSSVNGSYTPSWVFDNYHVPRVTEINGTVFPVYWNSIYLQKLTDFVNAVAARYDNNPFVAAVEIGVGQGGETEPDGSASNNPNQLQLWQHYGYTNALWWQTLQHIVAIYKAAWKHTPLVLMVTSTFLQSHDTYYNRKLVEQYAVSQGLWLQINSLNDSMSASILNGLGGLTATVEEQKQSAKQSGYPALNDVKQAVTLGARYALIFAEDLSNPANADALSYAGQQVTPPVMQDCSGHNLALSVAGRVAPVPGMSGQSNHIAQMFDGSTGTASSSQSPLSDTGTWSMEAWLYPTMLPQTGALAVLNGRDGNGSNGGGFGFGIAGATGGTGSDLVAYFPGFGWIDSGYTFPATQQWYNVAMTRDGTTVQFYVNGQKTPNTSTLAPGAVPGLGHFSIGSGYDQASGAANHFFTGAIDEVAVYTRALAVTQIQAYYAKVKK